MDAKRYEAGGGRHPIQDCCPLAAGVPCSAEADDGEPHAAGSREEQHDEACPPTLTGFEVSGLGGVSLRPEG